MLKIMADNEITGPIISASLVVTIYDCNFCR